MKKFITALSVLLLPTVCVATWSELDRQKYVNLMFNTAMKYKTYDEILTTKESLYTIYCIGDFYEDNYTYNEFEDMFYNGNDKKVEEFNQVSEICINLVKTSRTLEPKHYY